MRPIFTAARRRVLRHMVVLICEAISCEFGGIGYYQKSLNGYNENLDDEMSHPEMSDSSGFFQNEIESCYFIKVAKSLRFFSMAMLVGIKSLSMK